MLIPGNISKEICGCFLCPIRNSELQQVNEYISAPELRDLCDLYFEDASILEMRSREMRMNNN